MSIDARPRAADGNVVIQLLTTAARLFTGPFDDPPNAAHLSRMLAGWSTERRITERGRFIGGSTFNVTVLSIWNGDGALTGWLNLDWNDAAVTVRVGIPTKAGGDAFPFELYQTYFVGVAQKCEAAPESVLELTVAGRSKRLDLPWVADTYRGFGGGASLAAGTLLRGPASSPTLDAPGGVTIERFGRIEAAPAADTTLFARGTAYALVLKTDLSLELTASPGGTLASAPASVPSSGAVMVGATIAADGVTVALYAGTNGEDVTQIATATFGAPVSLATGRAKVGDEADQEPWEVRLWGLARDIDTISSQAGGPITGVADRADLLECWKFEDGTGDTAAGQKGVDLVTASGSIAWVSSLEGDDPEVFQASALAGQTKPDGWGAARNVRVSPVDTQRNDAQWSRVASTDLRRLYLAGAPLVPDETQVSTAAGQVVFTTSPNTISFTPAGGLTGHRFVGAQTDPARAGQQIEVLSSGSNDGTYDVISADEAGIVVVQALLPGTGASGTVVRSLAADVQYSYDLARSTVRTPQAVQGDLTADVVLRIGSEGMTLSQLATLLLAPVQPDFSLLTWDPPLAFWVAPGAAITARQILDSAAASAMAWWVETRAGGYRFGTWALPSGDPVAVFGPGNIIPPLEPVPTVIPFSRIDAGYDRTQVVQDRGSLAGSVSTAMRDLLGAEWRVAPRRMTKAMRDRYPLAVPRPDKFETYLTTAADAERFLDLAAPFYLEPRRWLTLSAASLGGLAVDLMDPVWVQHPDPNVRIADGVLARVDAMSESTSSGIVTFDVWF